MKYKIYFEGHSNKQFVTIESSTYSTGPDFVDFYTIVPGIDMVNVGSYKSSSVRAIVSETDDKAEQRKNKLERILREPGLFERVGKKLDKVFCKK